MRRAPIIAMFMLSALLAACGPGNKQGTGTIVGAVAGGAAGAAIGGPKNRIPGLAIGALVGGIIGNQIGKSLDEEDRQMAAAAEYQALEYGAGWRADVLGQSAKPASRPDRAGQALPAGQPILPALYPHYLCWRRAADGARHGLPPA